MPALACGELRIPCLTRVPASETTAFRMGRMSALLQRKNSCRRLSLFLGLDMKAESLQRATELVA